MRVHPLNLGIAITAGALLAYGLWAIGVHPDRATMAVGGFVFLSCTLGCAIGMTYVEVRTGVSAKLLGTLFFLAGLALHLLFVLAGFSFSAYAISGGLAFLAFVFLIGTVLSAEQA